MRLAGHAHPRARAEFSQSERSSEAHGRTFWIIVFSIFSVRAMACDITAFESPDCFREAIIPLITKM
jgi:hypothetical protein